MAQLAHETISTAHRNLIAERLSTIKVEIEAVIRLLQNNNVKMKYTELERLIRRQNDLLNIALNEGLLDEQIAHLTIKGTRNETA